MPIFRNRPLFWNGGSNLVEILMYGVYDDIDTSLSDNMPRVPRVISQKK